MDFPLRTLHPTPQSITKESVANALSIASASILAIQQTLTADVLVHIESSAFAFVQPDFQKIMAIEGRYVIMYSSILPKYPYD